MPAELNLPDLQTLFGFGVAGNFAGHLEQAGEAADFVGIGEHQPEAPKGIFPWYAPRPEDAAAGAGKVADAEERVPASQLSEADWAPGADGIPAFLRTFPISADRVVRPAGDEVNLQIEPEVGLIARVAYDPDSGAATALQPVAIGAFNDCSIRRAGAQKISHKKNWGAASKGLAPVLLPLDSLDPDGPTATYRLACFLRRDGDTHVYGIDSALPDYSYYGDTLLDWIVERLAGQQGAPDSPLEPVGAYLRAAGNPEHVLIGIGATRYTPFGGTTFLDVGDDAIVVVYDAAQTDAGVVEAAVRAGGEDALPGASVLRQRVVAAGV